jgi:DNA-binding HxlR family transcriptional regulator
VTVTTKRSYADGCAAAHALDLVGERWALLVVRELVFGPKRFTDLRAGLPGISPNVLTQRLHELEQVAVVRKVKLPPPVGSWVYQLTDWGRQLEPILMQLGRWGARSPFMDRTAELSADSLVLSFRTMFDPRAAAGFKARYEFRFGEDRFRAEVAGDHIEVARGVAEAPDAILISDPPTLAGLVYDDHDLAEAVRTGALTVRGDMTAVERFVTLFALPPKAQAHAA